MKKILIIGSPGSGKSTLSRKLSQKLNIPCVHLDKLWWKEDWVHVSREEFDVLLQTELEKDSWIMDGNFNRTLHHRLEYADTVIWMDFPTHICLWRVWHRRGKKRPDMPQNCVEKLNRDFFEFLVYIWNFKKKNNNRIKNLLDNCDADVIVIKNDKQLKEFEKGIGIE